MNNKFFGRLYLGAKRREGIANVSLSPHSLFFCDLPFHSAIGGLCGLRVCTLFFSRPYCHAVSSAACRLFGISAGETLLRCRGGWCASEMNAQQTTSAIITSDIRHERVVIAIRHISPDHPRIVSPFVTCPLTLPMEDYAA